MDNLSPAPASQANWVIHHQGNKLRLESNKGSHDFVINSVSADGDAVLHRVDNHPDFSANTRRTLQVHTDLPEQVYATVHDGRVNPTFKLMKQEGDMWKMTFKRKMYKPHEALFGDMQGIDKKAFW